MSRFLSAALGVAMLVACGPGVASAADACGQVAGARWLYYSEGGFNGAQVISTGIIDFRGGVVGGPRLATTGPTPLAPGAASAHWGDSTLEKTVACQVLPGNVAQFAGTSGGHYKFAVSADGKTAIVTGADANISTLVGKAYRVSP